MSLFHPLGTFTIGTFFSVLRVSSRQRRKLMYGSWLEWLYIHEGNSRSPEGKASRRDIPWEKLYSFAPENCTRCVTEFCRACSLIDFSTSSVPPAGLETFASASPIFSLPPFPLGSDRLRFVGLVTNFVRSIESPSVECKPFVIRNITVSFVVRYVQFEWQLIFQFFGSFVEKFFCII